MLYPSIGEPNIEPPTTEPIILPGFVFLTCGQNITIPSVGIDILSISCNIFNGSDIITTEVFINGIATGYSFQSVVINPFGNTDFGNYTFVVSTRRCGSTSSVSWILPSKFLSLSTIVLNSRDRPEKQWHPQFMHL